MADGAAFPLTPAQSLFLAGQIKAGDDPIYNMGWRFDIFGALDQTRFAASFERVTSAHDGLCLRLRERESAVLQEVASPPRLEIKDFSDAPSNAIEDWIAAEMVRPFDLHHETWRSTLAKCSDTHWVWFLCQHHVVADASTGQALFHAVSRDYAGDSSLPATQYRDFVARTVPDETLQDHWNTVAAAQTDRNAPYGKIGYSETTTSHAVRCDLGPDRTARLDTLATHPEFRTFSRDLSSFALLMTVQAAWISRLTGNKNLCIGAPAHLRLTQEDRAGMGLYMETFPFRLSLEPGESFGSLHRKVMAEVQSWLRHAKPGAVTPLAASSYTSVFNYLPMRFEAFAGLRVEAEFVHSGAHDAGHDHQLAVLRPDSSDGPIRLQFRLNNAAYGPMARAHAPTHWLCLLDAMLDDVTAEIETVPLGGDILKGPSEPQHKTVLEAFAERCASAPDAIAISQGERKLSYREFDDLVSQYAGGCRAAGAGPDDLVLVWKERSIETVAAIWGILRAGAAYVPFPSDAPRDRVAKVAKRHGIDAAIRSPQTADLEGVAQIDPVLSEGAFGPVNQDTRAYVIFTSGSTGEPKGVAVDHHGLAQYLGWNRKEFPGDHSLATSIGFDTSITPLFMPLTAGTTVRVYPETGSPDLAIRDVFAEDCVDVVNLTPTQCRLVLADSPKPRRICRLKFTGERLTVSVAKAAAAMAPGHLAIGNEYGPTETVVGSSLHWFDPESDTGANVSVGYPGPGVDIAIMDRALQPLPQGFAGELCLGGRQAIGYLDRDDLTADRFVTVNGVRLYRTGDLARIEEDGRMSYLDRIDDQLKISGVRVEPAEVAAAFEEIDGVSRAHVGPVMLDDGAEAARIELAAWVMGTGDPSDWLTILRQKLPPEWVPTRVAQVERFALLPSGKLDKAALPEPPVRKAAVALWVPPNEGVETTLAEIIAAELNNDRVGALDNIYDLGVDSLMAVRISMQASSRGLGVHAAMIFQHQTVRAMAEALAHQNQAVAEADETPAPPPLLDLDTSDFDAIRKALGET